MVQSFHHAQRKFASRKACDKKHQVIGLHFKCLFNIALFLSQFLFRRGRCGKTAFSIPGPNGPFEV
jgi:hypothetical protein